MVPCVQRSAIGGRAAAISAVDAVVATHAISCADPIVLTSDPGDLTDLVAGNPNPVIVARA